jgi:hypothetical protein
VRRTFARRPLRQRIVALVAAYAIALASLIASFGAAQATAAAVNGGTGIICHSDVAERAPATGPHESNGTLCFKSCIGCITSLATVIPPTVAAAGPPQLWFKRIDLPARVVRIARAQLNAHRSRGPPPVL